jgi:hypothetical protein
VAAVAIAGPALAARLSQAGLPPSDYRPDAAAADAHDVPGWAAVAADGTLLKGPNARRAARIARGAYEVDFDSRLEACSMTATLNANVSAAIFAEPRRGADHGVFVGLVDRHGHGVDAPFNLTLTC